MPDTRKSFKAAPAGFKPGQGRFTETANDAEFTATDLYQYFYHVTLEDLDGKISDKNGCKIRSFHVSFYGIDDKKYGLIAWTFSFANNSYMVSDRWGVCKSKAAISNECGVRAIARVLKRCKFDCAIDNPFAVAPAPVAVAAVAAVAPAVPLVGGPPVIGGPAPIVPAPPIPAPAVALDADPGAPGAPVPVGGPVGLGNLALVPPALVQNIPL